MDALRKLILFMLLVGTSCADYSIRYSRQAPGSPPEDSNNASKPDYDSNNASQPGYDSDATELYELEQPKVEEDHEEIVLDRLFSGSMSRDDCKETLKRALSLLEKPKLPVKTTRRGPNYNQQAKNLLKFMTQDPYIGSTSEDSAPESSRLREDPVFCEPIVAPSSLKPFKIETMQKIVELANKGASERSIQGKYSRYKRQYLPFFKRCVESGSTQRSRSDEINEYTLKKFTEARSAGHPVHGTLLQAWARRRAVEVNATSFKASSFWLEHFTKRYGIVGRKVTDLVSRAEQDQREAIEESRLRFLREYRARASLFPRRLIWNVDQTGFNYEISNERTLSFKGERDTRLHIDSKNKNTHSYTAQPIISRKGKLVGKLLLCLQETSDKFGPRIEPRVRELEHRFGNIHVVCSTSGKMTKQHMDRWVHEVLIPASYVQISNQGGEPDTPDPTEEDIATAAEDEFFVDYCEIEANSNSNRSVVAGPCQPTTPVYLMPYEQRMLSQAGMRSCNSTSCEPIAGPSWAPDPGQMLNYEHRMLGQARTMSLISEDVNDGHILKYYCSWIRGEVIQIMKLSTE